MKARGAKQPVRAMGTRKLPQEIVADLLGSLRMTFYADLKDGEKRFFWERSLLLKCITHPARVLEPRGAILPWDEYQGLVLKIIGTIKVYGDTGAIRSPGRYLLKAVQEHMKRHWEEYYDRAKALRGAVETEVARLGVQDARGADSTVVALAALNKAVMVTGGRKKAAPAEDRQMGLF